MSLLLFKKASLTMYAPHRTGINHSIRCRGIGSVSTLVRIRAQRWSKVHVCVQPMYTVDMDGSLQGMFLLNTFSIGFSKTIIQEKPSLKWSIHIHCISDSSMVVWGSFHTLDLKQFSQQLCSVLYQHNLHNLFPPPSSHRAPFKYRVLVSFSGQPENNISRLWWCW